MKITPPLIHRIENGVYYIYDSEGASVAKIYGDEKLAEFVALSCNEAIRTSQKEHGAITSLTQQIEEIGNLLEAVIYGDATIKIRSG